jgi:hypothetical protein
MNELLSNIKNGWYIINNNKTFRLQFIITLIALAILLYFFPKFLSFIETRQGVVLNDPLLNMFSPVDVTWLTFLVIYLSIITAIIYFIQDAKLLLTAISTYGIMIIFRIMAMYILPLDPPVQMIALQDPFVEFFGQSSTLTRDLFFSGHTSIMFLFFLIAKNRYLKYLFLSGTVAIVTLVLIQHVHYSVDVFVAFFVSYCSYIIAKNIVK